MKKEIDTYAGYTDPDHGFFSSNEQKWITRIKKLIEQYPDEFRVIKLPEENDGIIYVELPTTWIKIQPKKKAKLTDEQREVLRERMKRIRRGSSPDE